MSNRNQMVYMIYIIKIYMYLTIMNIFNAEINFLS